MAGRPWPPPARGSPARRPGQVPKESRGPTYGTLRSQRMHGAVCAENAWLRGRGCEPNILPRPPGSDLSGRLRTVPATDGPRNHPTGRPNWPVPECTVSKQPHSARFSVHACEQEPAVQSGRRGTGRREMTDETRVPSEGEALVQYLRDAAIEARRIGGESIFLDEYVERVKATPTIASSAAPRRPAPHPVAPVAVVPVGLVGRWSGGGSDVVVGEAEADHAADPATGGRGLQHLLGRIGHVAGGVEARYRGGPGFVRLDEVPEPVRVLRGLETE